MKRSAFLILTAALALTSACNNTQEAEIYPIQDNVEPRLMPRALFADTPDSLIAELGLEDGIPASVCAFLVKTDGKEILFDAANGAPDSQLLPALDSHAVTPEDIDHIFITHLHGDHIGGLVNDESAVFANADLHINKIELDSWLAMPAGQTGNLDKVMEAYKGRLHTFTPGDELPCGISAIEAYGHTAGHTMYQIGNIVIAGDIMHGTALQQKYPQFNARFDSDKEMATASRRSLLEYASKGGFKVYGMHFPAPYFIEF